MKSQWGQEQVGSLKQESMGTKSGSQECIGDIVWWLYGCHVSNIPCDSWCGVRQKKGCHVVKNTFPFLFDISHIVCPHNMPGKLIVLPQTGCYGTMSVIY